jgi:hypothetical protein
VGKDVIAHYGAAVVDTGLAEDDEAFLAALTLGKLSVNDEDDTATRLLLRSQMTHAFTTDPEQLELARQVLSIFGEEPDDQGTRKMVSGWMRELYGAPPHIHRQAW